MAYEIHHQRLRSVLLRLLPSGDKTVSSATNADIPAAARSMRAHKHRLVDAQAIQLRKIALRTVGGPTEFFAGVSTRPSDSLLVLIEIADAFTAVVKDK